MSRLPVGKLPNRLLEQLLGSLPTDPSVVLGPGVGRDAAAVRVGERVVVLKTDPITFATDEIGWYAPNVNANDIACLGARPRWMLVTALLAEREATEERVRHLFEDLRAACRELGVTLVGGHTEITAGFDRTVLVGMMIGELDESELIDPRRARPGDTIVLARGIAIEGTALLARQWGNRLAAQLDPELLARARRFLHDPGISVVAAAALLRDRFGSELHALHDPTEGGLATGLRELARVAGAGLMVDADRIAVYPETRRICAALGLDPLGLIASGALLAVMPPAAADRAVSTLEDQGIPAAIIGQLTDDQGAATMLRGGQSGPLPSFPVDEIARLVASDAPPSS